MPVSPPRPRGPQLNALRAFESAARLGSFTAAAEELCVTPGAVAQHIKALEAWADARLFSRSSRGVELTPLGEDLLPAFSLAFDRLHEAVQSLRSRAAPRKIRIATLPAIAQLWLSSRLRRLREAAREISVSVIALERPPNLSREPYDVSLFFEAEPSGENAIEIERDFLVPVCTAGIAARIESVDDLRHETLLRDSTWIGDWEYWLDSVPGGKRVTAVGPVHSLFSVAVEEARHGAGVLMARESLVRAALVSGDLAIPLDHRVAVDSPLIMRISPGFAGSESCKLLLAALRRHDPGQRVESGGPQR